MRPFILTLSCGKIMKDENAMVSNRLCYLRRRWLRCRRLIRKLQMFHASKTSHENFEESTENIKPLTEEERKEQAAKLKEKIKV